jgi:hypothetical protein
MPVDLNIKLTQEEIKGLRDPDRFAEAAYENIIGPVTKYLAHGARHGLSELLNSYSIKGGVGVRATGTAAKNLFVGGYREGPISYRAHFVYEGNLTKANLFIRRGTAGGKMPPIPNILAWMQAKGTGNFITPSPNRYRPPAGRLGAGSPTTGRTDPLTRVAWAIARSITKKGTAVSHKPLYPGGQKRFDYVTYAVEKLKMIHKLYQVLSATELPFLNRVLVAYLRTGRLNRGTGYRGIRLGRIRV